MIRIRPDGLAARPDLCRATIRKEAMFSKAFCDEIKKSSGGRVLGVRKLLINLYSLCATEKELRSSPHIRTDHSSSLPG